MEEKQSLSGLVKKHLVDSTAIYISSTPIYTFFENVVLGMSDKVSMSARVTAGILTYLGMGFAISRGQDLSKMVFGVVDSSPESTKVLHDALYLTGFTALVSPFVYEISGASLDENALGTLTAMALAVPVGPVIGYTKDVFRDLCGIKESKRVPRRIQHAPPIVKRGIAAVAVAAFMGLAGLIYYVTPDKERNQAQEQQVLLGELEQK